MAWNSIVASRKSNNLKTPFTGYIPLRFHIVNCKRSIPISTGQVVSMYNCFCRTDRWDYWMRTLFRLLPVDNNNIDKEIMVHNYMLVHSSLFTIILF